MFVLTAIGILWASLALYLSVWLPHGSALGRRRDQRVAAWLFDGLVAALLTLGTLGILVALYGWNEASAFSALRETALPSSLALAGLGLAIACVRADRGIGRALLEPGPGGELLRRLLPVAVLVPPVLGFVEHFVPLPTGLAAYGGAPFVVVQIAVAIWFIARAARWVQRFNVQREQAQEALANEMRSHASLLKESELRFRLLAEAQPQIVWTATVDGLVDYLSPGWTRFCGVSEALGLDWGWEEFIHPQDVQRTHAAWKKAVLSGESYEVDYRLRRHDGCYRWFLRRATPVRDDADQLPRWYGADMDIDELCRARDALRLSEARFRVALQDRDFIVWTQDEHLRYTWIHNPGRRYEASRALGATDSSLLHVSEEAARLNAIKRRVMETGEPYSGLVTLTIQSEQRCYEMRMHALTNHAGGCTGLAGSAYDITDRNRAEQALRSDAEA